MSVAVLHTTIKRNKNPVEDASRWSPGWQVSDQPGGHVYQDLAESCQQLHGGQGEPQAGGGAGVPGWSVERSVRRSVQYQHKDEDDGSSSRCQIPH